MNNRVACILSCSSWYWQVECNALRVKLETRHSIWLLVGIRINITMATQPLTSFHVCRWCGGMTVLVMHYLCIICTCLCMCLYVHGCSQPHVIWIYANASTYDHMYIEDINGYSTGTLLCCRMAVHVLMLSSLHTSVLFLCTFSSTRIILPGRLMEEESQREDNASCLSPSLVLHPDKEMLYTRLM